MTSVPASDAASAAARATGRNPSRRAASGRSSSAGHSPSAAHTVGLPDRQRRTSVRPSTTSGWPTTASSRTAARAPASPYDLDDKEGGHIPSLVHMHPDETVGQAIEVLREYGAPQMPAASPTPATRT
ncbi:hypothetical protein SALBM217S_02833 [Streptomyces griseoloalbus]